MRLLLWLSRMGVLSFGAVLRVVPPLPVDGMMRILTGCHVVNRKVWTLSRLC